MSKNNESRRSFLKKSAIASAGAAAVFRHEDKNLIAHAAESKPAPATASSTGFPSGKIKGLEVSRLICGGNLISGFAHSRDLIYVSPLLKEYFTDEKVLDTLEICEENGINTAILRVDQHTLRIIDKFWNERGGKMQWFAQCTLSAENVTSNIDKAIDAGCHAAYLHGGIGDSMVENKQFDILGKAVDHIKKQGIPGGAAGHMTETVKAYEKAGIGADFYMKTLNSKSYWSAGPTPRMDSVWAETPEETVKFMESVKKPWIAYKVLGAGAIHPDEGFHYAFESGADFLCVGMFDFQVTEDVIIAKRILAEKLKRKRPWVA